MTLGSPFDSEFPFLSGRTFIEAPHPVVTSCGQAEFPFLFGRAFIEGCGLRAAFCGKVDFPSFWRGFH